MENINIGDKVVLIHGDNVYELELGKDYNISDIHHNGNNIFISVNNSEMLYNLKRFKYGVKLIRKSKLDKLFSK